MPDSPRTPAFTWDPSLYGRFDASRLRPALELLSGVRHPSPDRVHDLGTGRGEIARAMAQRWPEAEVTGSDLSAEMLMEAATTPSRVEWVQQDIRTWKPSTPLDVIYSNAVLHWIDDHDVLFPRLLSFLAPGGVMAAQMPLSCDEPSHLLMRECLASGSPDGGPVGGAALRATLARRPVNAADWYYDLLAPLAVSVDIWETRYLQVLEGDNPVVDWMSGTALRPVFDELDDAQRAVFLTRYESAIRRAYPPRPDGTTLFSFPRLFIVATR